MLIIIWVYNFVEMGLFQVSAIVYANSQCPLVVLHVPLYLILIHMVEVGISRYLLQRNQGEPEQ